MQVETLRESIAEANRFLAAAKRVEIKEITPIYTFEGEKYLKVRDYTKESAACKRASMDLSRVLARLRNGN